MRIMHFYFADEQYIAMIGRELSVYLNFLFLVETYNLIHLLPETFRFLPCERNLDVLVMCGEPQILSSCDDL